MIDQRSPILLGLVLGLFLGLQPDGLAAGVEDSSSGFLRDVADSHALILQASAELGGAHSLLQEVVGIVDAFEAELATSDPDGEAIASRIAETEERLWLVVDALLPLECREDLCSRLPEGLPPPASAVEHALHLPGVTPDQARSFLDLQASASQDEVAVLPELLMLMTDEQREAFASLPRGVTPVRMLAAPDKLFRDLVVGEDEAKRLAQLSRRSRRRARSVMKHVGALRRPSRRASPAGAPASPVADALTAIRSYRAEAILETFAPAEVAAWVRGPEAQAAQPAVLRAARSAPAPAAFPGERPELVAGTNALPIAGRTRRLELYLPAKPAGAPVLFIWHGLGDTARGIARGFAAAELATTHGAIVVVPQSSGIFVATEWGYFGGDPAIDLSLFDGTLACLEAQFDIDNERVYTAGFSAGALWSTYLLMHRSEYLAAGALFSGGVDPVFLPYHHPRFHLPVLSIHGGPDDIVGVVNFHAASAEFEKRLRRDGHFVISYDHGRRHSIPFDPDAFAIPFLFAHSLGDETLPYEQGLGEEWPESATAR